MPIDYEPARRQRLVLPAWSMMALGFALASLLPVIYFILVLLQERYGHSWVRKWGLPSEAICEAACFAVPIWSMAAMVLALRSVKHHEHWRKAAMIAAWLAIVGATWFVCKVIVMVFFTPW
jgi:hypothetical protein